MTLKYININNDDEKKEWDDFVLSSPQGSVFSQSWYLDALSAKFKILVVMDDANNILSGIVLAKNQINTWSNPMLDKYLGVLFTNEQYGISQKQLSEQFKIMELLGEELKKYKSFDYYFHPNFLNWTALYWKGFAQQTRYTYVLSLTQDIEISYQKFHTNIKRNIKHAIKQQVVIHRNIEFDFFYDVINATFLRQGSKAPFDTNSFKKFYTVLSKNKVLNTFGAYNKNQKLISVCGLVHDKNAAYLLLSGTDTKNDIRGSNALLIFNAMEYYKKQGIPYFDFEGSMLPGVEQFYRRFGGDLVPYYRIWNDNLFNYFKSYAKKVYKKYRYGR